MLSALRVGNLALALVSLFSALRAIDYSSGPAALFSITGLIWVLAPFAVFDWVLRRNAGSGWPSIIAAAAALVSGLASAALYARLLLFEALPAEQSLAALILLPAYQLGFSAVTLAIIAFGRMLLR
jgi:hypothetical protein